MIVHMKQEYSEDYRVLLKGGAGEITEKKSRFIATVARVEDETQALAFIEEMKKKYWDASHNCSAFVIGPGGETARCSDDGEPSKTAGRPMLEVLLGEGIRNVAVVVTRYFGGTMLGTGGLVRAYTQAVKAGLSGCVTGMMRYGFLILVETDYNGIGRILYLLAQRGIETKGAEYTENVRLEFHVRAEEWGFLEKEIVEATGGRAGIEVIQKGYFIDKEITIGVQ